jgi:nanoRNase/pAp phosphatase (c-di-AMP/oligoRNAs hydrolase)
MTDKTTTTLKGFRKPRLDEEVKNEISKSEIVRLNIDIEKDTLHKFKIYLAQHNKTMREVLTEHIKELIK